MPSTQGLRRGLLKGGVWLGESEEKFRSIFENANDGLMFLDTSGKVLDVNESAARIFGESKEELIGRHFTDVCAVSPEKKSIVETSFREVLAGKKFILPLHIKNKKGQEIDIECSASLVQSEGKALGVIAAARDVTERKQAERELRRNEERLKILYEYAPDACVLFDMEGNFVDGNRAAERLLGYTRDEAIGKNIFDLEMFLPNGTEKALEKLAMSVNGQPTGPDEFVLIRKDGKPVTVETRTFPVRIEGRKLIYAIARDITLRKWAEEAKDKLLSNTSHELRTPLTSIEGYARFMLSGKAGDLSEEQEKCLEVIVEESDRLGGLIDNFLDLITIDIEGLRMDVKEVSIVQIVGRVISSMGIELKKKRISLSKKFPSVLGPVRGDETRLNQLFSNLLSNAIKFTPTGGSVEIRSRMSSEGTIVEVADTGIGISSKDVPHIFERFYQADSSSARKFKGVGLGLAICSEIVDAHGGRIEVESELGKGSVFRVILPQVEEALDGE